MTAADVQRLLVDKTIRTVAADPETAIVDAIAGDL